MKPETKAAVAQILADKLDRPLTLAEQQPQTTLDQLGLDSLDRMELTLAVEQRFGFSGDQVPANLGQFWALAQGLAEREPQKPPPPAWFRPAGDDGHLGIEGDTLAEAFVTRALAHPNDVAAADDLTGVLTYERLLVGALTLSRRFAVYPPKTSACCCRHRSPVRWPSWLCTWPASCRSCSTGPPARPTWPTPPGPWA